MNEMERINKIKEKINNAKKKYDDDKFFSSLIENYNTHIESKKIVEQIRDNTEKNNDVFIIIIELLNDINEDIKNIESINPNISKNNKHSYLKKGKGNLAYNAFKKSGVSEFAKKRKEKIYAEQKKKESKY